ncbi:hypothetical protein [uncultured Desulfuromusa sp.]|uniref:hypothetical protein n=1 Tax=uncultured Desulfuromusa sp. TaxID=219183 RepID=UPI002AA71843|nr:hypothetical protein [uncultured Desulfuromusa sp.]
MAVTRVLFAAVLFLSLAWVAYAAQAPRIERQGHLPVPDPSIYAADPQPLTLEQCGQCHLKHFQDLKLTGGKHQFDCRECHTIFHAYNPRKENYAAIMPDCSNCHNLIHGEKHSQCLLCHENPHAVQQAPAIGLVINSCTDCHVEQSDKLASRPSQHTELACDHCHHTTHGLVPSCAECHQPHFDTQTFTSCTECHDVHQPLGIVFTKNIELKTCDACHSDIYSKWQSTPSKHGQVNCASCHDRHRKIPECQTCHATPPAHSKTMLEKFPRCLDCHLDVHDLPVKN